MAGRRDTKTYRLQIIIRDSLGNRIDEIAKELGVSRSAFCALVLGYAVKSYDMAIDIAANFLKDPDARAQMEELFSKK